MCWFLNIKKEKKEKKESLKWIKYWSLLFVPANYLHGLKSGLAISSFMSDKVFIKWFASNFFLLFFHFSLLRENAFHKLFESMMNV